MSITEAFAHVRAVYAWELATAQIGAAAIMAGLAGKEGERAMAKMAQAFDQIGKGPPSIEDQYGSEVASDVAALEARQLEWLQKRNGHHE